ncbi:MAG: hypothetical protein VCE91_17880 [Nitrospinota bacterium]
MERNRPVSGLPGIRLPGAGVSHHAKRWHVRVASAFPPARHCRAVLGYG